MNNIFVSILNICNVGVPVDFRGCSNSIAANPEANNHLSSETIDLHTGELLT